VQTHLFSIKPTALSKKKGKMPQIFLDRAASFSAAR
jgi:hypothetical protein